MSECLYAVIFENGTVKVGMTEGKPGFPRSMVHYHEGKRWGIKVQFEIIEPISTGDLGFRELVLCGYCQKEATLVDGWEWFKFPTSHGAKQSIEEIFEKMRRNEFGSPQKRGWGLIEEKEERDKKFLAAMNFVRSGMTGSEAAVKVGIPPQAVLKRRQYQQYEYDRLEAERREALHLRAPSTGNYLMR